MASGSEMEVVLVAQVSSLVKGMQEGAAATQQLLNTIKQMSGGMAAVGQATKPANDAVKTLAGTLQNWKADQVGQARTAAFLGRTISEIGGASNVAAQGLGKFAEVGLEILSSGGILGVGLAAAGAIKWAFTALTEESRKAAEAAKADALKIAEAYTAAAEKMGDAISEASQKLQGITGVRRVYEEWKLAGERAQFLTSEIRALSAAYQALNNNLILEGGVGAESGVESEQMVALRERIASLQAQLAGVETARGRFPVLARKQLQLEDQAAGKEADKAALEIIETRRKLIEGSFDRLIADVAAKNAKLLEALSKPAANESYDAAKQFREVREPALQMRAEYAMKQPVIDTDFFAKGQVKALEPLKKIQDEMKKTAEVGAAVGDAFGSVFASIGSAIGGTAGEFIAQVGAMIAQTIALVLALAFSDTLMQGPLGVYAAIPMAAAILASLVGMIASVPSFEVGTMSVPRTGLAMVHQGEAILPADGTAQAYRSGGRSVNVTFNVNAMDGQSVYRTLTASRSDLARVVREAVRDGAM